MAGGLALSKSGGATMADPQVSEPTSSVIGMRFERRDIVRFRMVGIAAATSNLNRLLAVPNARITAVCDRQRESARRGIWWPKPGSPSRRCSRAATTISKTWYSATTSISSMSPRLGIGMFPWPWRP